MSEVLSWIFGSYANKDWWYLNKESIALGLFMAMVGGVVFALFHEFTKAVIWAWVKKQL